MKVVRRFLTGEKIYKAIYYDEPFSTTIFSNTPANFFQYFFPLFAAENRTDVLITELMKAQKAQNDPQKVLEEMERERKEMEEMFTIKAGEAEKLREKDVLSNA